MLQRALDPDYCHCSILQTGLEPFLTDSAFNHFYCYPAPMKVCIVLLAVSGLAVPALAAVPNEADYPTRYDIATTIKVGSFMIGKFCTMSLRDEAAPAVLYTVQRRGYGGCQVLDSGQTYHGKREKNSIKLLMKDDKGNLKVEDWPITMTVAVPPPPPNQ